jgi:hypothetical protein
VAQFNDEEIGGKAYEPFGVTLHGDKTRAKGLIGYGQALLGNLKHRMQLGGLEQGRERKVLPDGSVIQFSSIKGPLADLDKIDIFVPQVSSDKSGRRYRCIGYVVQGFTDDSQTYVDFYVELPSGKTLGYHGQHGIGVLQDVDLIEVPSGDKFPDKGVKLVDREEVDAERGVEYQEILFQYIRFANNYIGYGPITAHADYGSSELPPISSYYEYVFGACESTVSYILYDEIGGEVFDYGVITGTPLPSITTNPLTSPATGVPWDGTGLSGSDWAQAVNAYSRGVLYPSTIIPEVAHASATMYAHLLEDLYFDQEWLEYTIMVNSDNSPLHGYRRKDGHGFIAAMGFEFRQSGYYFYDRDMAHGEGVLFMLPASEDKKLFALAPSLLEEQSALDNERIAHLQDVGYIGESLGGWDCGLDDNWGSWNIGNTVKDSRNNVDSIYSEVHETTDQFAIPCKVEQGVHKVWLSRSSNTVDVKKILVHLFIEDIGRITLTLNDISIAEGKSQWDKVIYINVTDFDDLDRYRELVRLVDSE